MKVCKTCKVARGDAEFSHWRGECKRCRKVYFTTYRNRPEIKKLRKEHRYKYWHMVEKVNPEYMKRVRANKAKYYQRTRPVIDAKGREERLKVKFAVIEAYGGKCMCCGEPNWEFLSMDHIGGGGNLHRKKTGLKGVDFYRWLRRNKFPKTDYQLLCYNCNLSLGFLGYCPHA